MPGPARPGPAAPALPDSAGPDPSVREPSLAEVAAAIAASWGPETWYARVDDALDGPERHPSRNQCGTSALVLQDWVGGELLVADVTRDGQPAGVHYWNRLPDGTEVDLTREQFVPGETVGSPAPVSRPPGPLAHGAEPYEELARRVRTILDPDGGAVSWRAPGRTA